MASHSRAVFIRAGQDARAIGAEGHACDKARMAFEGEKLRTRLGVPQPRGVVRRAGQDARAIGAEGHAHDKARVAFENQPLLAFPMRQVQRDFGGRPKRAYFPCQDYRFGVGQGFQRKQRRRAEVLVLDLVFGHSGEKLSRLS